MNINKLLSNVYADISDIIDELNTIRSELGSTKTELQEQMQRGSGSYAIVDINTPGRGGSGTLVTDTSASHGQAVQIITSSSVNYASVTGTFSDVKFGHYAICARVKISSKTSNDIVQLKLVNGSTEILAANFKGTQFSSTSQYCYLYSTFTYEAINGAKQPLTFQLHTHKIDGIQVSFDYVYISMIIPSVFV